MPIRTVSHIQGNHLQPRPSVSKRLNLAGKILWLPPKEELGIDEGLEDGCYNHPVVVLSPKISDGKVEILILTSFNGVDLSMKHAHNIKARAAHLPIEPCSPHPDNGILLSLEGDMFLHKNSYVKTENCHTISYMILRSYDRSGESFVLTSDSYQVLINYVNFTPVTSTTASPFPDDHDRLLRLPNLVFQPATGLSTPWHNYRYNENPRLHHLEDEERRTHGDSRYSTFQNRPNSQHNTSRSYGNFTNNSKRTQYSQLDPRPDPGSYGNDGLDVWVVQAIEVAKGVAKGAWDWIRGSTGL